MPKAPRINLVVELYVIPRGDTTDDWERLGRALAPLTGGEYAELEDGTVVVPRHALMRSAAILDVGVSELAMALGGRYVRKVVTAKIKGAV